MLEIFFHGNISKDCNNQTFLHSHAVFSYLNQAGEIAIVARHLKEDKMSYTGEIIIPPAKDKIGRQFQKNAGIEVCKLF